MILKHTVDNFLNGCVVIPGRFEAFLAIRSVSPLTCDHLFGDLCVGFLGGIAGSRGAAAVGCHKGVEAFRFELRYLSVSICLFGIRPGLHLVKISDFLYEHLEASRFESRRLSVGICFL